MPFRSKAQRRWMHAVHPEMAKRWEKETPKGEALPEYVAPGPEGEKMASYDVGVTEGMRKAAAELLEDREDSRLRARAELMKMTPEERKRYLADMSARNHRLAMAYPETKTAAAADMLAGGKADHARKKPNPKELAMGKKVEREHTHSPELAAEIARDHLAEIPDYYTRLKAMEAQAKTAAVKGPVAILSPHPESWAYLRQQIARRGKKPDFLKARLQEELSRPPIRGFGASGYLPRKSKVI